MERTRFAPSPTGFLHIGGLRTALYAYLYAKQRKGRFILRLEDTDLERKVEGADEVIYSTLKQAGLIYDEGPDVGGKYGPYIQSERKGTYFKYAEKLIKAGGAYYCFCTKEKLAKLKEDGKAKYDKSCLGLSNKEVKALLSANTPFVIRQNIPLEGETSYTDLVFGEIKVLNKELEDGVLIKSDGLPTYNFANVIDDYLMNITTVIRGTEYLSSTPKYCLIYRKLALKEPCYMHLQPIMKDSTQKLSKRHGDASFSDFISRGFIPEAILNYIALLGFSPKDNKEKMSLNEMIELFSLDGISKSPSIFDEEKLKWLNSLYIKELDPQRFYTLALPFLQKVEHLKGYNLEFIAGLIQSRIATLDEAYSITKFLVEFDNFNLSLFDNEKQKISISYAKQILPGIIKVTKSGFDNLFDALSCFASENGYKKTAVLWVFRIAITGATNTPGGASEMAMLLGKEETIKRLKATLARLSSNE